MGIPHLAPLDDPTTRPFWDGVAAGELRLPQCERCGQWQWYPLPDVPHACGGQLVWRAVRPQGTVFTHTTVRRPFLPDDTSSVPYTSCLVELDDAPGVRLVGRLADGAAVEVGQRVAADFITDDGRPTVQFVPVPTRRDTGGCPVIDVDYRLPRPAFWHYQELNRRREESPAYWNEDGAGYWMITRLSEVREAFQDPTAFTNDAVSALDPELSILLLPQMLNPPLHTKYRKILNPFFSPRVVERLEPTTRERCRLLVEEVRGQGGCDVVNGFGLVYPTEVFIGLIGLPLEDVRLFVPWVEAFFAGVTGDPERAERAAEEAYAYFRATVADRVRRPRDPATDFVSYLLASTVDDEPLPHDEVVTICFTLMLAGLDTTRSQLGYIFWHLATHPDDRRRLIAEPELLPGAVEEFVRLYSLIIQAGRRVAKDIDFHGCPMKEGDMVWLGVSSANRDPRVFDDPDAFVPDRPANPHLAFAAGPHRCLGAHLARNELLVALEEWHHAIPDYRLAATAPLHERGAQLTLLTVPLEWDVS
jgi:cytochrome P450/uncharacterized OB-fold protein